MKFADRRSFLGMSLGTLAAFVCTKSSQGYENPSNLQLEVIASCLEDAQAAHEGGATRLEVAVNLQKGGFTPPLELIKQIVDKVPIPARIMLREREGFSLSGPAELEVLLKKAKAIAQLNVGGIVFGYLKDGRMDLDTMRKIVSAAPSTRFTVHNVIESADDPLRALESLKEISQIDIALVHGGKGDLSQRIDGLKAYKRVWGDDRHILANGYRLDQLNFVRRASGVTEFHVSQQVRIPEKPYPVGKVNVSKVKEARKLLFG